jgi:hypothetical protein
MEYISITEWSGFDTADPLDQTNGTAVATLTDPYDFFVGEITPTVDHSLVICGIMAFKTGLPMDSTPTSIGMTNLTAPLAVLYPYYVIQGLLARFNPPASFTTTDAVVVASFKPPS